MAILPVKGACYLDCNEVMNIFYPLVSLAFAGYHVSVWVPKAPGRFCLYEPLHTSFMEAGIQHQVK